LVWYIAQPVTDSETDPKKLKPADPTTTNGTAEAVPTATLGQSVSAPSLPQEKKQSPEAKRRLFAAVLSALAPGAGQLLLGERLKGTVLLVLFAMVVFCFWPLRAPVWWEAFTVVILIWIGLSWYSVGAALLVRQSAVGPRPSKWWLLLVPVLTYVGINLVWTPLFLGAGFRTRIFLGSSMEPMLFDHDYLVVDADYYRHEAVRRDDLVVFSRKDSDWIKRVIAIGGDTIEAKDRRLLLNGQVLDEPFVQHKEVLGKDKELDSFGPVTVPAGKYFVMGDNRDVSLDSRVAGFGLVDGGAIVGRPLYVYRPRGRGWMIKRELR